MAQENAERQTAAAPRAVSEPGGRSNVVSVHEAGTLNSTPKNHIWPDLA